MLGGIALPVGVTVIYLVATDSLSPFIEIFTNLVPIYNRVTLGLIKVAENDRFRYLLEENFLTGNIALLPAALAGIVFASSIEHRKSRMLLWTLALSAIVPALAGKFYDYHYLPFSYVACLALALNLSSAPSGTKRLAVFGSSLIVVYSILNVCVPLIFQNTMPEAMRNSQARLATSGLVASYLHDHSRPGDKAQPLDWTEGVLHGMLIARIPLATRFMADFEFYFSPEHPYVRRIRKEFLAELESAKPRWVIATAHKYKAWPGGPPDAAHFQELEDYLVAHYTKATSTDKVLILERIPGQ
jgi:hypothetical protein